MTDEEFAALKSEIEARLGVLSNEDRERIMSGNPPNIELARMSERWVNEAVRRELLILMTGRAQS